MIGLLVAFAYGLFLWFFRGLGFEEIYPLAMNALFLAYVFLAIVKGSFLLLATIKSFFFADRMGADFSKTIFTMVILAWIAFIVGTFGSVYGAFLLGNAFDGEVWSTLMLVIGAILVLIGLVLNNVKFTFKVKIRRTITYKEF